MDGEEATCVFTTAVKRKSERGVVKSTVIQLPVRGASLFRLFISGHELEKEGEKTAWYTTVEREELLLLHFLLILTPY